MLVQSRSGMERMQEECKPDKCGDLGLEFHLAQTREVNKAHACAEGPEGV